MGISNDLPYTISYDNLHYEKSLKPLNNSEIEDLLQKIEILKINPHSIAKRLKKPYEDKHSVRIYGKRYRLIIIINDNSKRIKLIHVSPRPKAYLI